MSDVATPNPFKIGGKAWDRYDVMAVVCDKIASSSKSLRTILSEGHNGHALPGSGELLLWLGEDEELNRQYARAKAAQMEFLGEEMLEIADDARNDFMEKFDKYGDSIGYFLNGEHVQRSKLRSDTRKWLMSKLAPKKYGDKLAVGGADDLPPIKSEVVIDPSEAYQRMLASRGG